MLTSDERLAATLADDRSYRAQLFRLTSAEDRDALDRLLRASPQVVVANTILAMSIDVETFRPRLGNIMGGLSGSAVKPIVVRMTYQCARAVNIPIIGCGGISTAHDAVEYMLAGATAVQVGTATFLRPKAMVDVIDGLAAYCDRKGIARAADLTGAVIDTNMVVDELEVVP